MTNPVKTDAFRDPSLHPGMLASGTHAYTVTPADNIFLPQTPRYLWVGTAGNLTVLLSGDTVPVTFVNLPVGWVNLRACQVFATGTTAQNIVAVW